MAGSAHAPVRPPATPITTNRPTPNSVSASAEARDTERNLARAVVRRTTGSWRIARRVTGASAIVASVRHSEYRFAPTCLDGLGEPRHALDRLGEHAHAPTRAG